ncbi:uncharacterized protein [Lepeophtheirus salmonis]|uniref:uncharacterized protein n=1 Tax=Lepeophtheirus salmonis TaxID=72036 RepID=UPI001AE82D3A|nr:uncharacterized protein LOC121115728 [Lepeophtheirus salmonis]
MCELTPISLTSLSRTHKRKDSILNNIKTQDKSNIPTCFSEITSSWIRMVVNQFQIRRGLEPFEENEDLQILKGVDCKHNAGKLSSVYLLTIQISDSYFHFVAKFLPPDDVSILEACSNNVFEKEISIYFDLLPAIKCHVSKSIVNLLPEVIYASHNQTGAGVIVFKSCVMDGFTTCEDPNGLNPQQLILTIKSLAKLHAFASKFIEDATPEAVMERYDFLNLNLNVNKQFRKEESTNIDPELESKFEDIVSVPHKEYFNDKFLTIIHGEYWEPNLMFDELNGMQILDWKHARLGSGVFDLAFLLGTRVMDSNDINDYISLYFDAYVEACKMVGHTEGFTLEELHEEYANVSSHQANISIARALKKEIKYLSNGNKSCRYQEFKTRVELVLSRILINNSLFNQKK